MDKLELQSTCFQNIKSLCVNYRKDSSARKTADYLNKRLSSLENQWQDFDSRHALLVLELEDKTLNYFADDIYGKTKELYYTTKQDIVSRLSDLKKQQNVSFDLAGTSADIAAQADDGNRAQLLLNKQECNFNAMYRVITKINSNASIEEKWELDDHLNTLNSKWESIDKLHWEIDFLLKGSNGSYYETYNDVEQNYDELKKRLSSKLWSTVHYSKSTPKIEIPEFSGSYSQWISFKDLFLEAIHKNPMINTAQKMQHLKTKLRGEAERLVQHLTISADNYSSCWEILNQRYDNRRLQFSSFMNSMINLPNIQNPDSFNLKKMHDVITECMNGISNIGIDTSTWGPMIVHIMALKLDSHTLSDYMKENQNHREVQNLKDFMYFLETQFMAYESVKSAKKGTPTTSTEKSSNWKFNKQTSMKKHNFSYKNCNYYAKQLKCPHCNGSHVLMHCDKFLEMDLSKRNTTISKLQLCKNCLFSHGNEDCKSTKTCRECNLKHHTLLHNPSQKNITSTKHNKEKASSSTSATQQHTSNHVNTMDVEVLLTTVQLKVKSLDGTYVKLRALLDQGSQVNLITENAAQLLRLPRSNVNACVTGIGTVSGDCRGQLNLTCKSIHSDYYFTTQALIMKKLTNNIPTKTVGKIEWPHLMNLKLADPDYNISSQIDILLGAEIYSEIILDGVLKGSNQSPVAQQTQIGWILCGKTKSTFNCNVALINLEELTKFWETEDIQLTKDISKDDQCEKFYTETVTRSQDGSYIVKMPFSSNFEEKLGKSRSVAVSQFLQLEKRLERKQKLAIMYKKFIEEYIELGHMKLATPVSPISCYLPHHGVLRECSTTTKLRVVFNASQKTSSGYSLNSLMEKGVNLQQDIQALILKWRTYQYVFTADIEKMYRCIWMSEEQQDLQRIIWRASPDQPLQDWRLCTVTYGTKSAPWLAIRTLKQLAMDDGHKHPEAAKILQTECYVDDVISGHNCVKEAQKLQKSLIELLKGGGMNLRKWSSNHHAILENLDEDQISKQSNFDFKSDETAKTLGLGWNPSSDTFHFNWRVKQTKRLTKRSLLSEISKLYDPLGWLSPVTVKAKLLFQKLWISKLGWDDDVPSDIETEWTKLNGELTYISNMKLKRWISDTQQRVELLGFCDASEKAYACVIYSRVQSDTEGQPIITLLVAKTRVAPLTQKTTLPRLELCGAVLLANLMEKTISALSGFSVTVQAWSDSQVALAWIQGDTSKWETYVANRVTKIKHIIPAAQWKYVKSEENPADCASRGLLPSKLMSYNLWWHGPEFLTKQEQSENIACSFQTKIDYVHHVVTKQVQTEDQQNFISYLLHKYSSMTFITRVVAWIHRFIVNTRYQMKSEPIYLTPSELTAAMTIIINYVQRIEFNIEYKQLNGTENISKRSSIFKLNPYLDEKGIIRVGGRLKNSSMPPEMKNPIIIPHKGRLTQLLIEQAHSLTLHGGARLTLMYLRQRYWIVGGNRAVKTLLQKCVRCHRFKPTDSHQLMGDLPRQRITPCRPFTHTGVDFAGPVEVKHNKGRGVKTSKGYISIFICMATKAVHIELVSDLSTETFIAAFQRLCARRGTPKHMYSDCGTNFVGAARVLREEFELFQQILNPEIFSDLAKLEVEWHFNAPAWPSAGGLWEAAVKSMKHHLRRVLGTQKLTYEEFSTLLAKIEACLNSRPLCPLTEDPEEFYNCLTPGHFLTGSPILSLPLSDYNDMNIDIRRRWQLCEKMFHQYWKNWSNEYLTTLQTRCKWNKPNKNIEKGDIVLVKEENLPPGKWALGRVMETHPGSDGLVRVTTIKTQNGTMKRPVIKLSPLPLDTEIQSEEQAIKKPKHKTKGNNLIATLLITTLTLFTFVSGAYGISNTERIATDADALITNLKPERPVYYDTVGKMQVVHDEWILIMYYNLTNYWDGIQRTQTFFANLKNLCLQTKLQHCQTTMEQLSHEMELLNYYNYVLINPHKHLSNRKKRGLVNGVGYIANSLFGILDQGFADKYENDIKSLQNNENYLLTLIKNQTTIVELENQVLKKSEANIQRQFNTIESFVNQTNMNLASIETEMKILSATTYLNSASLNAYLLINSLRTFQEMLFNTLTNVYQGHIDVHLITPVHLMEQLGEISRNLPKTVSLPIENYNENIKEVYKLITVKARVTESYFIFEVQIPLVSNEDYIIYQVIPLPLQGAEKTTAKSMIVQITSKYIAVNLKKNAYILLSEENLKQCVLQRSLYYLCKNNLPSYDLHSSKAPCEAKLLSHQNNAPCNLTTTECKAEWIELHAPNSWLAVCCDTCSLRTICNNDIAPHTMTSSSLVTLSEGCVLQSKDLTIYAHRQYNSRMKMDYEWAVPSLDTSINNIVNLSYIYIPNTHQFSSTEIEISKIEERIKTQRENEAQQTTISTHDVIQYSICYFLLAAGTITALVVVGRKRCRRRFKNKTIAPQRHEEIELQVIERKRAIDTSSPGKDNSAGSGTRTSRRASSNGRNNIAFDFD